MDRTGQSGGTCTDYRGIILLHGFHSVQQSLFICFNIPFLCTNPVIWTDMDYHRTENETNGEISSVIERIHEGGKDSDNALFR